MADLPTESPRFEQVLGELDRILRELEDGTTTLEESLERYERGMKLLRLCYRQLKDAEIRIQQLSTMGDDAQIELKPFDHKAAISKNAPTNRRYTPGSEDTPLS